MFHSIFKAKTFKRVLSLCFFFALCLILNACKEEKLAKYVFFFIGDGASYAQRRLTELANAEKMFINTLPIQGSMTTAAVQSNLPDNAAAAGALASGKQVEESMISMLGKDLPAVPLITSVAAQNGYTVGILTDTALDDAVAASFYAHSPKKQNYYDIAVQAKDSGISLMIGQAFKRPKSFKKEDLKDVLRAGGYKQISSVTQKEQLPSGKVITAFRKIPFTIDAKASSPSLALFVEKAIEKFRQEKGFVLITIAGKMNQAAQMHDTAALMREMDSFDLAVKKAYDFYREHPQETLIVVAGTVETGGMTLGINNSADLNIDVLKNQKTSAESFKTVINRFRKRRQVGASLEDFMPQIEKNFGLLRLSKEQKKELTAQAKKEDEAAKQKLAMNLTAAELSELREAYRYSMTDTAKRPKTEAYLNKYGKYDPLQMAPMRILARRAGVGYSTFGQTAVPIPVSAVGNGAFFFMGSYPQTALFEKILRAMGLPLPAVTPHEPAPQTTTPVTPTASDSTTSPVPATDAKKAA